MIDESALDRFRHRVDDAVHDGLRGMAEHGQRAEQFRAQAAQARDRSLAEMARAGAGGPQDDPAPTEPLDDRSTGYAFQRAWEEDE